MEGLLKQQYIRFGNDVRDRWARCIGRAWGELGDPALIIKVNQKDGIAVGLLIFLLLLICTSYLRLVLPVVLCVFTFR